jgi:hypothetical protein
MAIVTYIHRNPVEDKTKMVSPLEDFRLSSYPAYINQLKALQWLSRENIYQMLGQRNRDKAFRKERRDENEALDFLPAIVLIMLQLKLFQLTKLQTQAIEK